MGEAPDVLVITHTAVLAGSGHPYNIQNFSWVDKKFCICSLDVVVHRMHDWQTAAL